MALLSQLIPPEELAKLNHTQLLLVSDAVHAELTKNQEVHKLVQSAAKAALTKVTKV